MADLLCPMVQWGPVGACYYALDRSTASRLTWKECTCNLLRMVFCRAIATLILFKVVCYSEQPKSHQPYFGHRIFSCLLFQILGSLAHQTPWLYRHMGRTAELWDALSDISLKIWISMLCLKAFEPTSVIFEPIVSLLCMFLEIKPIAFSRHSLPWGMCRIRPICKCHNKMPIKIHSLPSGRPYTQNKIWSCCF